MCLCQLFLIATHYSVDPVYYSKYKPLDNIRLLSEHSKEAYYVLSIIVSAEENAYKESTMEPYPEASGSHRPLLWDVEI